MDYSQLSSIIWSVWPNGSVFVYELRGCGFESSCSHLLVENKLKKSETFDSIYFRGKSHFEEDGTQNYLVFQPLYRYFRRIVGVGSGN